jgi:hypothetical protein
MVIYAERTQLVVRLGRAVDDVGETRSQRLLLAAAAAVLLGVPSYPPFVRIRPVYPRVHRLLLPLLSPGWLGVRRARGGHRDVNAPSAWLTAVEEGREWPAGCGCCRHEVRSSSTGGCGRSLSHRKRPNSQVVVGEVMTWVPPNKATSLTSCQFWSRVAHSSGHRKWSVFSDLYK